MKTKYEWRRNISILFSIPAYLLVIIPFCIFNGIHAAVEQAYDDTLGGRK